MKYYPAFLDLHDKKAVVVGGGNVAERKVRSLLKAGASVKVISPVITAGLKKFREKGQLKHIKRNYRKGDLKDAFIVIAGTSDNGVNSKIARDATCLVNVIDLPSDGNFIVPSNVIRGPLTISISTGGASPAVSKAIRREVESHYGTEFAPYLRFVKRVRKEAMKKITDSRKREKFLKTLASQKIIETLRDEGYRATVKKILNSMEQLK